MSWYVNDVSMQGQFGDWTKLEPVLTELMRARGTIEQLRVGLRTSRKLAERFVEGKVTFHHTIRNCSNSNLRKLVLLWLDRSGPFIEDDMAEEEDNYFEYAGIDVTDSGLGEAARRVKLGEAASTFSFENGAVNFAVTPLTVDHGLSGARLGQYPIENIWTVTALRNSAARSEIPAKSWVQLVETARRRFQNLHIPDSIHQNPMLAQEAFDTIIRDRTLILLGHLDEYMNDRSADGVEGPKARHIIDSFFTGERAAFTGESATNRKAFEAAMTFPDPADPTKSIFAHWHGKISHKFYRIHFEWPPPAKATVLKILYVGPKITKG